MRVKPTAVLLLLASLAWCGCAGLVVRHDDSVARQQAKTWAQVGLTVATLSVFAKVQAEVEDAERRRLEERQAREAAARFRRLWLHRILAARTAQQLTATFDAPPRRCRPSGAEREICVWTTAALLIRERDAGAVPMGRVELPLERITTHQVVIAACELPAAGGARAPHSCDVSFW